MKTFITFLSILAITIGLSYCDGVLRCIATHVELLVKILELILIYNQFVKDKRHRK